MNRADAVETKKRLMELADVTVDSTGRQVSSDGIKINMRYTGPEYRDDKPDAVAAAHGNPAYWSVELWIRGDTGYGATQVGPDAKGG